MSFRDIPPFMFGGPQFPVGGHPVGFPGGTFGPFPYGVQVAPQPVVMRQNQFNPTIPVPTVVMRPNQFNPTIPVPIAAVATVPSVPTVVGETDELVGYTTNGRPIYKKTTVVARTPIILPPYCPY